MSDLPDYEPPRRRFDEAEELTDLPDLPSENPVQKVRGIDKSRICEKCGKTEKEGVRVVSKIGMGVRAYCLCGHSWGIALSSPNPPIPVTTGRGLSKETLVEPDWNLAFENLDANTEYKRSWEDDD